MLIESVAIDSLIPDPSKTTGTGKNKQRWSVCADCKDGRWVRNDSTAKMCRSCVGRMRGALATRVKTGKHEHCSQCNGEFWCYKHLLGERKFCSKSCADSFKRRYEKQEKNCGSCGKLFVINDKPFSNSTGVYCSRQCKVDAFTTGVNIIHKASKAAANAGYAIRVAVKRGQVVKPDSCEQCSKTGVKIEAAHFNYSEKLRVRWLCVPCHRQWDTDEPKGGCVRIDLRQQNAN